MKQSQAIQLKKLIQELVRREIKSVVPQLIQEEVSKAMGKVLVEMVKEIKSPSPTAIIKESVEVEEEETVEEPEAEVPVFKTNNPKLTSALAETAKKFRGMPRDSSVAMADIMGTFEKVGGDEEVITEVATPTTNLGFMKQMIGESVTPATPSVLDSPEVPPHLKKLFKKDYRAILALSKEKRS
jgi:hypothetical protein